MNSKHIEIIFMNNELDNIYNKGYTDGYTNKKYDPYRILQNMTQEENITMLIERYDEGYKTGKFNFQIDNKSLYQYFNIIKK
jgi:hypothetical protein